MALPFWRYSSHTQPGHAPHPQTAQRREQIVALFDTGETTERIAEILDIDQTTVRSHLRRARAEGDSRATDARVARSLAAKPSRLVTSQGK